MNELIKIEAGEYMYRGTRIWKSYDYQWWQSRRFGAATLKAVIAKINQA